MRKIWFIFVLVLAMAAIFGGIYYYLFYSKGYSLEVFLSYKFISKLQTLSLNDLEDAFFHDAWFMSAYSLLMGFLFFTLGWIFSGIGKPKNTIISPQNQDDSEIEKLTNELNQWMRKYQELYDLTQGVKVKTKRHTIEKISNYKSSIGPIEHPKKTPKDSHDLGIIPGLNAKYLSILRINDIHTFSDLAKASALILNQSIKKITGEDVDSQLWIDEAKKYID